MMLLVGICYARQVRLYGYVIDEDNVGIEAANVYIEGTTIGTTTNRSGYYNLLFDYKDTLVIAYSLIGYQAIRQQIIPHQDVMQINVVLPQDAALIDEIEVKGLRHQTGTMDRLETSQTRLMPDASGGSIESLLITFAGVTQNNELSSQYNVRGGNFDENSVYVNGIEIHRPLLIRAGQQEGLSFVNPQMVENVDFSAGGFDANYGDKMSSVLDITYKRPEKFEATISASILGANAYVGTGGKNYSMMHGIRYKTSKYMLGALPTTGNYDPNFLDYQTYITWRLTPKRENKDVNYWNMSFLGNFSQNSYGFRPDSISESFGTFTQSRRLEVGFDGQEKDLFRTAFGAIGVEGKINKQLKIGFSLSGFYTHERENFDITADYFLTDNPQKNSSVTGASSMESDSVKATVLGKGRYHQHARNTLEAGVITAAHNGEWKQQNNILKWGASVQAELINDHISEWEWRDSMGYSMPRHDDRMELYYSLQGSSNLQSIRLQAYAVDTYKWNTNKGKVLLTGGMRLNWWNFNNEVLVSPRASVTYIPGWKRDFSFRMETGLYYQAPFYKEIRDTITDAMGVTHIRLNDKLKAQRSVHVILGGDYYFRAWGRPFKLTAEVYYKYMDRVENYTVDNVRIRYSGQNDAIGYSTGADIKLYGELVPGAESWISLSAMRSRQDLLNDDKGWIMGMNEQRFAFSMLFQDYIPKLPQCKVHLKTIVSDGLPACNPLNPSERFHMKTYFRLDIGASWTFSPKTDKWMQRSKHVKQWSVQFEVFNLVNFKNVNSYFWVADAQNTLWAFPNHLTGRMFNGKITVDFK